MSIFQKNIHGSSQWTDWRWQQKNAVRDEPALREICGGWDEEMSAHIEHNLKERKMQITPYYIDLIMSSLNSNQVTEHPLWRQVVPYWNDNALGDYDGTSENWELHHEMKTPICQHKYDNRVILRMTNTCNAYCGTSYLAGRDGETQRQLRLFPGLARIYSQYPGNRRSHSQRRRSTDAL